jgi:hypothetical protein
VTLPDIIAMLVIVPTLVAFVAAVGVLAYLASVEDM